MPLGSTVVITYDGDDITNSVMFAGTTFISQLNAMPGTFEISIKDPEQVMSFVTGREITLTIDGQRMFGGYVRTVNRKLAFPVDDTTASHGGPEAVKTRLWVLRGTDWNILFDGRVTRNPGNYLAQIPSFNSGRKDGDLIRNELCPKYLDLPGDLDYTTHVDDVVCPFSVTDDPTQASCVGGRKGAWLQQGTFWRKQMEDFQQFSGALFYIDGDKNLHWHSLETAESRWGFSDVPNNRAVVAGTGYQGATYGMREVDATEDGTLIVNDAMVWGGSEWAGSRGGTVFARRENEESQEEHNRWQLAETHFGEQGYGLQEGVNVRASVIVNGKPGSVGGDTNRGLRFPQWNFRFAWFGHDVPTLGGQKDHLVPGQMVPITMYTFGEDASHPLIQTLPLRQVTISFPNLDPEGNGYVRFDGVFSLQLSDPWTLWRYLLKNRTRITQTTIAYTDNTSEQSTFGSFGSFYPTETPDGSRTAFHVPFGYLSGTTSVFLNGILQRPGADYTESSPEDGEITFFHAPAVTDWIWVQCRTMAG